MAQAFEHRVCICLHASGTVSLRLRYGDAADWSAFHPLESDEESRRIANGRADRPPVSAAAFLMACRISSLQCCRLRLVMGLHFLFLIAAKGSRSVGFVTMPLVVHRLRGFSKLAWFGNAQGINLIEIWRPLGESNPSFKIENLVS